MLAQQMYEILLQYYVQNFLPQKPFLHKEANHFYLHLASMCKSSYIDVSNPRIVAMFYRRNASNTLTDR